MASPVGVSGNGNAVAALSSSVLENAKLIQAEDAPNDIVELASQVQKFASVFELTRGYSTMKKDIEGAERYATTCRPEIDALMKRFVSLNAPKSTKTASRSRRTSKDIANVIRIVHDLRDWATNLGLMAITQNTLVALESRPKSFSQDYLGEYGTKKAP